MAIVQMQRINICALKKNRKAILERLQELGAISGWKMKNSVRNRM